MKIIERNKTLLKTVLMVAFPIMIQNGFTNFVNLLDNIMVGRLGTEQMSGVAIVNELIFVYNLCIFGGLSGAGIFTAQYFGTKDFEGIKTTFRFKFWMGLILTLGAIAIFMLFGKKPIKDYARLYVAIKERETDYSYTYFIDKMRRKLNEKIKADIKKSLSR